jgi:NAD(P)-dependent dehydrogenase (short-subunit alcohol dehydrogenase family)
MELKDKICLITGASSGIGKAAAIEFAKANAELILLVRNKHRGEKAVAEIKKDTGNNNIRLFNTDLSSAAEIKTLTETLHKIYSRIDILVNSAGAYFSKLHLTVDGIEASYDVNYVARFLLVNQLLDLLLKAPAGQIINVTGENHRKGKLNFNVKGESDYSPDKAVSNAKLADMIFSMELARRLTNTNVTVKTVHPGIVKTNILNNDPDSTVCMRTFYNIIKYFFRDPQKAGKDIFYLATSEEAQKLSGKYFCRRKIKEPLPLVYDEEISSQLWKFTEELTGYKNPVFSKNKLIVENK